MAKIALNGRFTGATHPTGTQTAAAGCFNAILRNNKQNDFVLFADKSHPTVNEWAQIPSLKIIDIPFRSWSRWRAQLWEQFVFPREAKKNGCSVIHSPMTTNPMFTYGLASIVSLCDIHYITHPEWFSWMFRYSYAILSSIGLRRAEHVVCISEYVKSEAIRVLRIPPERVRTIYLGAKTLKDERPKSEVDIFPTILCVGSLQPHKNLSSVIQAFIRLKRDWQGIKLRIVGNPQLGFSKIPGIERLLCTPGVELTGYLSDTDLGDEYRKASVFCFPSFEEGFGLPVIEAMQFGTPVVTSSVSCLPEISGPDAILVDPYSVDSIANGIERALKLDQTQRTMIAERMREWVKRYDWEQIASQYHQLYLQAGK